MNRPGRNDPCPCGSGLKYKRCCLAKTLQRGPYTREDRQSACAKLLRFTENFLGAEDDFAYDFFWDQQPKGADDLDAHWEQHSDDVIDFWFWFDWILPEGDRAVDRLLTKDRSLTSGERNFLEGLRESCMRLYEAIDVVPGVSITFQDVFNGNTVTVHEKSGSKQIKRSDVLAARIIAIGPSGQAEIEAGLLSIPPLIRQSAIDQISAGKLRTVKSRRFRHALLQGIAATHTCDLGLVHYLPADSAVTKYRW